MIRRALVVVDGSKASLEAQKYAISLSKERQCRLTGMGVLDTPWITAAQPEPLGGAAYKLHRDDEVIRQSHERVNSILQDFKNKCKEAGLEGDTLEVEGFPASEIERLSQEHDLIIIGQKTDFHFDLEDDSDITVRHIARDNPRPILSVPAPRDGEFPRDVAVAYDGTLQSARALHMFLLLGLGEGRTLHILTVDRHQNEADEVAMRAVRMCEVYGVTAKPLGIASTKDAAKVLLKTIETLPVGLVVIGAFSHSTLSEVLFGSCASTFMKKSKFPLFIHH